jgi:glutathionyl-hydroquinone reductase
VSEFEALCANDGELAKLRTSIRDFLATDRAAFGWEPAVGSYRLAVAITIGCSTTVTPSMTWACTPSTN